MLEGYAILEKVLPLHCPDIAYITEGYVKKAMLKGFAFALPRIRTESFKGYAMLGNRLP